MFKSFFKSFNDRLSVILLSYLIIFFSSGLSAAILSGVVKDHVGNPIAGAHAMLFQLKNGRLLQEGETIKVGEDGLYEWAVLPGSYVLRTYFNATDVTLAGAPDHATMTSADFEVYSDTVKNAQFEFISLSGNVHDTNGSPINNVNVQTSIGWQGPEQGALLEISRQSLSHANGSVKTDENGNYVMLLFPTRDCNNSEFVLDSSECVYQLNYIPHAQSGFATSVRADFAINNSQALNQELVLVDTLKPKIVSGPFIKNITDSSATIEWQTDEPVTSVTQVIGGKSYTNNILQTHHSLVITELSPSTSFTLEITTQDEQKNSLVTTDVSFSTLADFTDNLAPTFIQAPFVSNITDKQVTVQFCADEPVNGKILFDQIEFSLPELSACHELTISNLNSNQSYSLSVEINDLKLNGPVTSEMSYVKTLAAADLSPPIIVSGPYITDISSTSAVITWTTNEASSSSISFNDGISYRAINDQALVSEHSLVLTELKANTTYTFTIGSEDISGNIVTTDVPSEFKTSATADNTPPLLLGRALVEDVRSTSAIIKWTTDESASSVVYLGSSENALTRVETSPGFNTSHLLSIAGLLPDSIYYFYVESSDIDGNKTTGNITSFTTDPEDSGTDLEIVSQPIIERLYGNSITLSWSTNFNSNSRLVCESNSGIKEVNKTALTKNHYMTLIGLEFNTAYRCVIYSVDISGMIASKVIGALTTEEVDSTPPSCLTPPTIQAFVNYAEVNWESDELSTATLSYRTKGSTDWSQSSYPTPSIDGQGQLTKLSPDTVYEFKLTLTDSVGNQADCALQEFTSGTETGSPDVPPPAFTISPFVDQIGTNTATVNWSTEHSTNGQVKYGTNESTLDNLESSSENKLAHAVVLNNLMSNTTYFLNVDAFNVDGNEVTSEIISFTTKAEAIDKVSPPTIIFGPIVRNITDTSAVIEWETDKSANSTVEITGGETITKGALTTQHSVVLTGLTPETAYSTLVSSTDSNNLTTEKRPADFTTLATPDTSLPKFVSGPTISGIDYDSFTVSFCANEPVTSVISVQLSGTSDISRFSIDNASVCHEFKVNELSPRTLYYVIVEITDLADNGPVQSEELSVTTLFEPDILPPVITGPIVTDITNNSAIVRWTTNEAADSHVIYSDGSTSGERYESELVSTHVIHLTNLSPGTTYTLSASSTDALGNGPATSDPVQFTTLSLPDTAAPTITYGPIVENITTSSADVLWETNELATGTVYIGLTQDNLNLTFNHSGFDNYHSVPLSQLSPDTLYYFKVESSDISGNTATSNTSTFKTLKPGVAPISLQIIDGPNVVNATTDSLTVEWETNLDSDSRLVCEAEQTTSTNSSEIGIDALNSESNSSIQLNAESTSSNGDLAPYYSASSSNAISNQYIVLLKQPKEVVKYVRKTRSGNSDDSSVQFYGLSENQTPQERKASVSALAHDISQSVSAQVLMEYSSAVNGFVLKMNPSGIDLLRTDPRILLIEQDQIMEASAIQPNATWGLDRIDQKALPLDSNFAYKLDGTGVNAYIIDTGILTSHADFGGRAVHGWNFVENNADASDCNGHGTHVAGTVGGATWGVAKNVSLTSIKVLNCNGSGTNSGVIGGVDWVTANAQMPAVANMSLGGGSSAALDAAVQRAIDAGITVAVAAGNSNTNACYGSPNRLPDAITVASSTSTDRRSSFSNWGSCIDIFAPGSSITSTWHNGGTHTISGTSMAAPHVAGAIALYLQAHPDASPEELASSIKGFATTNKISQLNGSPNLLLNTEFDSETALPTTPPPAPIEKVTFEVSNPLKSKLHLLTLTGLSASTQYSCTIYSSDGNGNQVSAPLVGTTDDVPDITPPNCEGSPYVNPYINSADISWKSSELATAIVNYRERGQEDWDQKATLDFAKLDSIQLTGLEASTEYEQQITLTDVAGNSATCPSGYFTTYAPAAIPDPSFVVQPIITNITENTATVNWATLHPSTGIIRYSDESTDLHNQISDSQNSNNHSVVLNNLEANTVYYLKVDAINVLGVSVTSNLVSFKTLHIDNDFDKDGILNDIDNCPYIPNPEQTDTDNDGTGDACDPPTLVDNDFDNDGILNDVDNCPVNPNPDQTDSDGNGIGDACDIPIIPDTDYDNDGVDDDADNCPRIPNSDQADSDNNGIGDVCDAPPSLDSDYDEDGIPDDSDNCPRTANPDQTDSDNDGIGDACDTPTIVENDYDNDGILDENDNCPLTPNPDQADHDNNGKGDACDIPDTITPPPAEPVGINLRGVVTGEGTPLTDAVVSIYNREKEFIRSTNTPSDGTYLFENMASGDYFIGVTPPNNTDFASPPLKEISITDRDVVHLITLIGDAIKLSGYLTDSQGRVIDNVLVSLHEHNNGNQVGNRVRTDSLGYFEFSVVPGIYKIRPIIDVFNSAVQEVIPDYPVPDFAAVFYAASEIEVSESYSINIALPFALLSGQTLDVNGAPVAGVGLRIRHQQTVDSHTYYLDNYATDTSSNALSDENGQFEFALFTDQAVDIVLTPPVDRTDLAVTTINDYTLSTDANEDFTLVEGVSLSGTLQDLQGRPIDNTKLSLHLSDGGSQVGHYVYTDENGLYRFQVESGVYDIKPHLSPFGRSANQPTAYPLPDFATVIFGANDVEVTGATTKDIILPLSILNGTAVDSTGEPIPDTRIEISHINYVNQDSTDTGYFLESHGSSNVTHAKTNENGQFTLALFTDQAMDLNFVPPLSHLTSGATLFEDFEISADITETFTLSQPFIVSGYLKDEQDTPIDNTIVTIHNISNRQLADVPALTDNNGFYSFKVTKGNYQLRPYLQTVNQVNGEDVLSSYPVPDFAAVYYEPSNISVTTNTDIDVTLPMSVLSGKARDINGVVVPGVKLRADHAYTENNISYYLENTGNSENSNAITKIDGTFSFGLFTNQTTEISVNPPDNSGFAITQVSHSIDQETSEDIWLIHTNFAPPKIIAGPFVKSVTDSIAVIEWLTDKPATSVVDASNGRRYTDTELKTSHSMVLTGLSPVTEYQVAVHSVDKDSQSSDIHSTSFTTLLSPDFKAPLILEGPYASNISHDRFTVKLCADEPITGIISIDNTQYALQTPLICHELMIDQLSPDTTYTIKAEVVDQQGNGPTESQSVSVKTLAAPDVTAPVIELMPVVIDISDTHATVIWSTDEPATSGVSYNDGEQYHVVTDSKYVKQHTMPLADLKPETTYSLTVSSTDSLGNGPTTSDSISFTTLASPDTTPPIILGIPLIQNITHQSVVIRWTTSEPATTRLVIGTEINNLSQEESRNGLKTFHNLPVTRLIPDTIYYFQVQTSDAEGNLAMSEIMSFRTKVRGHQGDPYFMHDVEVLEITDSRLSVYWKTDVNADARLVCTSAHGTLEVSNAKRSKKHTLSITGLSADTTYNCNAFSTDHHGYTATKQIAGGTFSTPSTPTQNEQAVALVSEAIVNSFGEIALLELETDQLSLVFAEYKKDGTTSWQATSSNDVRQNHSVLLQGLSANSDYQLRFVLANIAGIKSEAHLLNFNSGALTDLQLPDFVSQPVVSQISAHSSNINWSNTLSAYGQVSFGKAIDDLLDKEANVDFDRDHQVVLTNLDSATIYYAQVTSYNLLGESITSNIVRFVTSASGELVDSDGDGITDSWEIEYDLDPQNPSDASQDPDNDGLSNLEEFISQTNPASSDSDQDGIPDGWEVDHALDPNDFGDATQDRNNDGTNNLNEFLVSTDTEAPVISLDEEITLDARGQLTAVPSDGVSASDNIDGSVDVINQSSSNLTSGQHVINWLAEDAAGNRTISTQTVNVNPLVLIEKSQTTIEDTLTSISVKLSGKAPHYPVYIPYTITGTANTDDYLISTKSNVTELSTSTTGRLVIEDGIEASLLLEVIDDQIIEADEQLIITLDAPVNAALGTHYQQVITITEANTSPELTLSAKQNEQVKTIVSRDDGVVTVLANVNDLNIDDSHTYDWSATSDALVDADANQASFSFDPQGLTEGVYTVSLVVSDDGSPIKSVTKSINIKVVASYPALSGQVDSDGDGISDLSEGFVDSDLDGIADYLDITDSPNLLQMSIDSGDSTDQFFMLEAEQGLMLTIGSTALYEDISGARLDSALLLNDIEHVNVGGLFDFEVHNILPIGRSIQLVIPLEVAIPEEASYRKYSETEGWIDFHTDTNNQLYSTMGDAGVCPAPGDSAYQQGLTEGHYCVMMLIEDGGPNDADGIANGAVVDPGGIAQPAAETTVSDDTNNDSNSATPSESGGGGAISILQLLWLIALLGLVQRTKLIRR